MNSRKKTYGVTGLMEWHCTLSSGGATLSIEFTGGTMTGRGSVPAKYTTENPVVQAIIENSIYFNQKRIKLLNDVEGSGIYQLPDPVKVEAPKAESIPEPEEEKEGKTVVEVTDIDEAKEYLVEHFGVARNTLRSAAAIKRVASEKGIEFNI